MAGGSGVSAVRATSGSSTGATVVVRRVDIFFKMSPGDPANQKGIEGAEWSLFDGELYVELGRTGADGKVTVELAAGTTYFLEILGSRYELTLNTAPLEAATDLRGQQRRLRMLGYHLGHAGPHGNGVDNMMGARTQCGVLDFQADEGLAVDAQVGGNTRSSLTSKAGA